MPEPVFDGSDRVDNTTTLPADLTAKLQGKNAQEQQGIIIQYYKDRETALLNEARRRIAAAQPSAPATVQSTTTQPGPSGTIPVLTKEQVWNDPVKVLNELKAGMMTVDQFNAATASARKTVIRMAEQLSSNGKKYFAKYRNEILAIMNNLPEDQQADPEYWDTAYNAVIGKHVDEIEAGAVTRATTPVIEPGQPGSETPEAQVDLSTLRATGKTALDVCAGLDVTPDNYRKAIKEMNNPGLGLTLGR